MMTIDEIKKLAKLAHLSITTEEIEKYKDINDILAFVETIKKTDTQHIKPMTHPISMTQRLREDQVTEENQRPDLQKIVPQPMESGLYLVPAVLED
jgi:aspartyl-tRNA(Asn)/glutamyl-tRNA(Gln) amidotransferase subunit C